MDQENFWSHYSRLVLISYRFFFSDPFNSCLLMVITFFIIYSQDQDLMVQRQYALDCGAGIGRITGNLLTKFFDKVDLVEQNPKFLEQAKLYLKSSLSRVGQFYSSGKCIL